MGVTISTLVARRRIPLLGALVTAGVLAACGPSPSGEPALGTAAAAVSGGSRAVSSAASPAASEEVAGGWHLGRPAVDSEVSRLDIDIMPDGRGLPPGSGNHAAGVAVFQATCAACHGPAGEGTPLAGPLVDPDPENGFRRRVVGHFWPYATTAFDYVRRAMPWDAPGTLTDDEVYAVVAWILAENGVIGREDVLDATSLPQVVMPGRARFVPDDRVGGTAVR